jgi:hypothetical protein
MYVCCYSLYVLVIGIVIQYILQDGGVRRAQEKKRMQKNTTTTTKKTTIHSLLYSL